MKKFIKNLAKKVATIVIIYELKKLVKEKIFKKKEKKQKKDQKKETTKTKKVRKRTQP